MSPPSPNTPISATGEVESPSPADIHSPDDRLKEDEAREAAAKQWSFAEREQRNKAFVKSYLAKSKVDLKTSPPDKATEKDGDSTSNHDESKEKDKKAASRPASALVGGTEEDWEVPQSRPMSHTVC